MPHLTSVASSRAILDFEGPRCRILAEIMAEIKLGAVSNMEVSHLFDILVGAVCNIDLPCVDELGKIVNISLPPVPGFVDFLGWHEVGECGTMDDCVLWCMA